MKQTRADHGSGAFAQPPEEERREKDRQPPDVEYGQMSDRKERGGEEECRSEAGTQKEAALRHRIPQSRLEVAAIKKLFRQCHHEKLIEHPQIKIGRKPRPEVRRRAVR